MGSVEWFKWVGDAPSTSVWKTVASDQFSGSCSHIRSTFVSREDAADLNWIDFPRSTRSTLLPNSADVATFSIRRRRGAPSPPALPPSSIHNPLPFQNVIQINRSAVMDAFIVTVGATAATLSTPPLHKEDTTEPPQGGGEVVTGEKIEQILPSKFSIFYIHVNNILFQFFCYIFTSILVQNLVESSKI